ncbi:telomerase RNA component interacting RNase isoform X1 [Anolis sagrei]|uniref:telomerase RNA component interacting RNase isoform X1 n=1 Tax=Anolis sagrei TaxID=38937 RepID=UPI0035205FF8
MAAAKGKGVPGGEASGPGGGVNVFANDGSFLELFKRRMEEASSAAARSGPEAGGREGAGAPREAEPPGEQEPEPPGKKRTGSALSFVGKRRGGSKLALKTGVVAKKQKTEDEVLTSKGDAWAKYMAEVKKYKAHQCSDDDKTRPLVK